MDDEVAHIGWLNYEEIHQRGTKRGHIANGETIGQQDCAV
jgi:hypothetical protein